MSNLNRLRELAALLQPKPVTESRIRTRADLDKKFKSMEEGINDAIKDLMFEVGTGGALETMMNDVGVSSHKDAPGILKTVTDAVEKFKNDINTAMMEAEGLLFSALSEDRHPEPVTEGKNHMDENTYQSVAAWKRALKKKHGDAVWYQKDEDTIDAFTGTKPFKKGETKQVGDWDDTTGTVY